jgi:hypothetical protein
MVLVWLVVPGCVQGWGQSHQWWPEADLSIKVGRLHLLAPMLVRLDTGLPNPQFVATGLIASYRLSRNWSVSGGYLYADLPQNSLNAHVPLGAVTGELHPGRLKLADTNRFERLLAYPTEPYRYRNRAMAEYAFGNARATHVYAANEYFYNLTSGGWNQNRVQGGIGQDMGRLRVDGYFLEKSAPGGKETAVIGTVLTVRVGKMGR